MKALEEKILKEGTVLPGNILKVGSFLNHQLDAALLMEMGREIARLYKDAGVTRILTIESSGIAIAVAAAAAMGVPAVFAKKNKSKNLNDDVYTVTVYSYTHDREYPVVVSKDYIKPDDRVLIVDDFLAVGNALRGLIALVGQAGAQVAGCAIAIEKGFQKGGDDLRAQGVRVESLALIDHMTDDSVIFRA
ncbi:MAG: xanthine phosphoribosyltransferase [Clostridia bacterium]|nr:xanthine phosphoribosyltransferase [Clostridia bacterium]